ncbi:MAG: T9SS type A sorting domain-containing protein, partial [Cytophagales bacterium]|nr:T9SS type A sorting domain-containing protein [Cytophagales bacterium]
FSAVCLGSPITFNVTFNNSVTGYQWNIDANYNSTVDYTTANPVHTYTAAGVYIVTATVTDFCNYKYTDNSTVTVNPVSNPTGFATCGSPASTFSVTSAIGGSTYMWMKDPTSTANWGTGNPLTINTGTTSGSVWLMEASSAVTTVGTGTISSTTSNTTTLATTSAIPAITSLVVSNTLTLNNFSFQLDGSWYDATGYSKTYVIRVKNGSTVIASQNYVASTDRGTLGNPLPLNIVTLNQVMTPGTYTFEIFVTTPGDAGRNLIAFDTYTPSSIPGIILNAGNGSSKSYLKNINVSYTSTSYTTKVCANRTKIDYLCVLPVTWLSFTGNRTNNESVLDWKTVSEDNNNYFAIERSSDGISFEEIGRTSGYGNTKSTRTYQYRDLKPGQKANYYRIKQVDYDGKSTYSNIIYLVAQEKSDINIYPNPFANETTISIVGTEPEGLVEVSVYNTLGNLVQKSTYTNTDEISIGSSFSSGLYIVEVKQDEMLKTFKIIKQ